MTRNIKRKQTIVGDLKQVFKVFKYLDFVRRPGADDDDGDGGGGDGARSDG